MSKIGKHVKMSKHLKQKLRTNGSVEHVEEFGECVGLVEGYVDFQTQLGPEVDVRWLPSKLRYAYHPDDLDIVY